MRYALSHVRSSRIPAMIGVSSTDSRVTEYVNEATQRLLEMPEAWWGTTQSYVFCARNGCITLPRQVASVISVGICCWPIPVRNAWYEFTDNAIGLVSEGSCFDQLHNRDGIFPTFDDIIGVNMKLKVYADLPESATAKITLEGMDETGNWIHTTDTDGTIINGEKVLISTTPQLTTKKFSTVTRVTKPETNGTVRLYEYNSTNAVERPLGYYEHDETHPGYRRVLIPGISEEGDGDCETTKVTTRVKLHYMPVKRDTDWLLINSIPALKAMIQAILHRERNLYNEADRSEALAVRILNDQLGHFTGNDVPVPRMLESAAWAAGNIENVVD